MEHEQARIAWLQKRVETVLEAEGAQSDEGCSALASALLDALVKVRRDPRTAGASALEVRRLSGLLLELAEAPPESVDAMAVRLGLGTARLH